MHNPAVQAFSGGDEAAFALSSVMRASWTAFARSGNPQDGRLGGGTAGMPGVAGAAGVAGGAASSLDGQSGATGGVRLELGLDGTGVARNGSEKPAQWCAWEPTRRPTTVLGPWESDGLPARVAEDPRHEELDVTAAALGIGERTVR